jgi:nitrite reductase/ring-hydroxylating ferredoxin subunit
MLGINQIERILVECDRATSAATLLAKAHCRNKAGDKRSMGFWSSQYQGIMEPAIAPGMVTIAQEKEIGINLKLDVKLYPIGSEIESNKHKCTIAENKTMGWTSVLAADALAGDGRQVVKVGDLAILLLNHQGTIYAVDNLCPHLKLPMKKGKVTGDCAIVCPWHKSAFDLKSGAVRNWTPWPPVMGKVLGMVSSEKALTVFPTRIEEGQIWVEI